jgi:hypothetical protein
VEPGIQPHHLTKRFHALGQFSRYVRPGAVRHNVTGAPTGVQVSAFDRGGQWTLVVANQNASATSLTLHLNAENNVSFASATRTSATESMAAIGSPTISSGTLNANGTLIGGSSGKCVDVTGGGTANGTKVILWTCNGGSNQNWQRP